LGLWRVGFSLQSYITEPTQVTLVGRAIDIGVTAGGNQRVTMRLENSMRVMVYNRTHMPWASLGQELVVMGELRPLSRAANPGGYDQFRHLRGQKIDAYIWSQAVELGDVRLSPVVLLRTFRDRLSAVYDDLLPAREAAVIKSMVLGDRADMDRDLAMQYRTMGIFHILSISGLHVTILMMAANALLGLFIEKRKAGVAVLVLMVAYCLMTGASVSTVRAVTMGGVLVFGKVLNRQYDLLAAVGWAGVALLLYEPLYLFNVGFQLSFVAVFGIGVLTQPVERCLAKLRFREFGQFRKGLAVGIAATVSTYPVFAFHMYEIQLYSVLGNIVIAPTVTIILVVGIATGLVGLVWTGGAALLAGTVYFILRFYDVTSSFFSNLPYAMLLTGGGSLVVAGLGAAVLFMFAWAFCGFGQAFRKRLKILFFVATLFVASIVITRNPAGLHVTVLDTRGNYVVLRHRNDVLVIGEMCGGESALHTYLDMRGVRTADGLLLLTEQRAIDEQLYIVNYSRFENIYFSPNGGSNCFSQLIGWPQRVGNFRQVNNQDKRIVGNKELYFATDTGTVTGVQIVFGDTVINIGGPPPGAFPAHVHIADGIVKTADDSIDTREYGAVSLRSNGRQLRMLMR